MDESRAVHVAMRMAGHVISLRSQRSFRVIERAFRAWRERDGFRLLHFSVMGNHVHLVVEAESGPALSRAIQGIALRIAKGLNRIMGRRGRVFAGRYFNRVLHTPREVRTVLAYVLNNARHHRLKKNVKRNWVDEFSSAHAFDGWTIEVQSRAQDPPPIVVGRSAIVKRWQRAGGPIAPDFVPGAKDGLSLHPAVA
jgi:REP element-mobilizing transposase RayT